MSGPPSTAAAFLQRAAGLPLAAALRAALEAGTPPPCTGQQRDLWTSDHLADRAAAAVLCAGCPIFVTCADVAERNGERWCVWAGVDREVATNPGRYLC